MKKDRLITLAIHTYPKALILKGVLESQGIAECQFIKTSYISGGASANS